MKRSPAVPARRSSVEGYNFRIRTLLGAGALVLLGAAVGIVVRTILAKRMSHRVPGSRIPLALKLGHTAYVAILVPIYWWPYGPGNFLWFSDVALLLAVPALWRESPRLAGMQTISLVVPEGAWTIDFLAWLVAGRAVIGLADYMFGPKLPQYLRALSLFHLWLPPLLCSPLVLRGLTGPCSSRRAGRRSR